MFNVEEKIKEWKYLLNTEEIDEITYEEVNKLVRKSEKKKQHKKIDVLNLLKFSSKVIIFFMICAVLVWGDRTNNVTKNIEYVTSLAIYKNHDKVKRQEILIK